MFTGDLKWDRAAAKAELLRSITHEEVLALLDSEMLAKDGTKRVSVLLRGCCCCCGALNVRAVRCARYLPHQPPSVELNLPPPKRKLYSSKLS